MRVTELLYKVWHADETEEIFVHQRVLTAPRVDMPWQQYICLNLPRRCYKKEAAWQKRDYKRDYQEIRAAPCQEGVATKQHGRRELIIRKSEWNPATKVLQRSGMVEERLS